MIGIGTDILEIQRLEEAYRKHGRKFLEHFLTPDELKIADSKGMAISGFYAGRWAAKEAVSKMLGTGIGKDCSFQDINILNNEKGAPFVTLSGAAKAKANALGISKIHISISHEQNYCVAMVVGE